VFESLNIFREKYGSSSSCESNEWESLKLFEGDKLEASSWGES
jgi:hypothetical protein